MSTAERLEEVSGCRGATGAIRTIRNAGRRLGRELTHKRRRPRPAPLPQARETGRLNLSHLGAAGLEDALSAAVACGLRITEIDLSSNGLEGLPPGVAALPGLRVLRAKYNRLSRLPLEVLAQLPRCEHLDLEGNQITAVEENALPQLASQLKSLCLSSNGLLALPDGIGACTKLEALAASNNPLTQMPDSLGACPALTHRQLPPAGAPRQPGALPPAAPLLPEQRPHKGAHSAGPPQRHTQGVELQSQPTAPQI
jgi:hypothetical protein